MKEKLQKTQIEKLQKTQISTRGDQKILEWWAQQDPPSKRRSHAAPEKLA